MTFCGKVSFYNKILKSKVYMKVEIVNQTALQQKIAALKKGGAAKLQIVTDFDRTLTPALLAGQEAPNSAGVLAMSGVLDPAFSQLSDELFRKYYPIEIDPHMSLAEKLPLMEQWMFEAIEGMKKFGLSRSKIKEIIDSGMLQVRQGVDKFFGLARSSDIPLVVFSAGIGNVIEQFLLARGLKSDNVHILSNFLAYDTVGNVTGLDGKLINILNKSEAAIDEKYFYEELLSRPNVLLIGDSPRDTEMSKGIPHDCVLKIGLLNHYSEAKYLQFTQVYDLVLHGDGNFDEINKILLDIIR